MLLRIEYQSHVTSHRTNIVFIRIFHYSAHRISVSCGRFIPFRIEYHFLFGSFILLRIKYQSHATSHRTNIIFIRKLHAIAHRISFLCGTFMSLCIEYYFHPEASCHFNVPCHINRFSFSSGCLCHFRSNMIVMWALIPKSNGFFPAQKSKFWHSVFLVGSDLFNNTFASFWSKKLDY